MRRAIRRLARLGPAALLLAVALSPAAAPVLAADVVLSRPTTTVRFLEAITFRGTATLPFPVHRVEIVLDIEGSTRSITADVLPSGATGRVDLRYDLATPSGGLYPNTEVTGHFRATLDDGTEVDGPSVTIRYDDTRYDWQVLNGDLVTVHWTEGGTAFGRRALRIAEDAVRDVGDLLGVRESDPIDFIVYADRDAFYDVLGAASRENVGGVAPPGVRTLFALIGPGAIDAPWVSSVIPHELTHLVFDTVVDNPYHYPPRWLNEGIAVYLSEGYTAGDRADVEAAASDGSLMPLRALTGEFPTTVEQFSLAYAESTSAVDFLVRRYGEEAMVQLVRTYAQGVTDDEALRAALGTDVAGFEAAWLDEIDAPQPIPYGPLDAPPGPVPSDWVGEGPVPGAITSASPSPEPLATPTSGTSGTGSPGAGSAGDAGGATSLLAGLVLLGLALAGIRLGLARRGRPSAGGMVASAPPPDLDAGGHSASDPSVGDPLAGDSSVADPVLEQHGP